MDLIVEVKRMFKVTGREYLAPKPEMRVPKDTALVSSPISSVNKFVNDDNFVSKVIMQQNEVECSAQDVVNCEETQKADCSLTVQKSSNHEQPLSANQIAAKAMQLRLKGKLEETDRLLKEAENIKVNQNACEKMAKLRNDVSFSRYAAHDKSLQQKSKEDDSDIHLAQAIMKNKHYSMSAQADIEYEYDGESCKKKRKQGDGKTPGKSIVTQQDRCHFCFANRQRPEHLVVAIANLTYLMLPQFTPVATGHCCIVTMQGLRASIPKDFPYFHVEFGLDKGFVHVIDDETQFKSGFGLDVIRGMLPSQADDVYRRRRYESLDVQKQTVAEFSKDWGPFDWTKQLRV